MLPWLLACEAPPDSDPASEDSDLPSTTASPSCHTDADAEGLDEARTLDSGVLSRLVHVPSDTLGEASILVFFPPLATPGLWDDGAPVTVSASPPQADAVNYYPSTTGIVEVQPLYPGRTWGSDTAAGDYDELGVSSAQAVADSIRFALGEVTTTEGWTLAQVAERAVCDHELVVLGTSGGGGPSLAALEQLDADLRARIIGVVNFESATNPPLMGGDAGRVWADPDDDADGDGNGYTWDDARNRAAGPCEGDQCAIDLGQLAWDPYTDLDALYDPFFIASGPGALYLERSGDTTLTLDAASPDTDHNGAIDDDEDLPLTPHQGAFEGDGVPRLYYTPEVVQAAIDQAVLDEGAWPDHLATAAMVEVYWADRSLMDHLPTVDGFHPDASFVGVFTAADHGLPLVERPHVRQLYGGMAALGWPVRYNDVADGAACVGLDMMLDGWGGPPPEGEELGPEAMQQWALPDSADPLARGFAVLGIYARVLGAFDACEG